MLQKILSSHQWRRYTRTRQVKWPGWRTELSPWLAPWLPPWLTKISINFINIAHKRINLCAPKRKSRFTFYTRSLLFTIYNICTVIRVWRVGPGPLREHWPRSQALQAFAAIDLPYSLIDLEMTWLSWRHGAATASHYKPGIGKVPVVLVKDQLDRTVLAEDATAYSLTTLKANTIR